MAAKPIPLRARRRFGGAARSLDLHDRTRLFGLSALAGIIHLWVTPAHFEEWWGYGSFFLVVGSLQLVYGWLWLVTGFNKSTSRRLARVGLGMNLLLFGLYVVTRTLGIPVFGPHAGEVEPIGAIDVASKFVELLLTLTLLSALRRIHRPSQSNRVAAGS